MFGGGSNNEEERLRSVSIPQNFSWTGLERGGNTTETTEPAGLSHQIDPANVLHDLVLWNTLGYALDDEDFTSLVRVSKDWQAMCKVLQPVLIQKLTRLLNPGVTLKPSHLSILKQIFTQLRDVDTCSLYRRDSAIASNSFPTLQPQFNIVLMNFVVQLCTHRRASATPDGTVLSGELYDMCVAFLKDVSEKAVDDMWGVMSQVHANSTAADLEEALRKIIKIHVHHDGLTTTIDNIAGYLNRYHVRSHSLRQLADYSRHEFVNALGLRVEDSTASVVDSALFRFMQQVVKSAPQFSATGRALLLQAARAIDSFSVILQANRAMKLVRMAFVGNETLNAVLGRARQEEEESQPVDAPMENGRPIRFALLGPNKKREELSVPVTAPVVRGSGFLQKLHLRPGDAVHVKVCFSDLRAILEKVVAFYNENDVRPMPEIDPPLPFGASMSDLVGPFYAELANSCEMNVLFELVNFANLMDFRRLLDLGCLAVSFHVRNRSEEELRRLFNIQGEESEGDNV